MAKNPLQMTKDELPKLVKQLEKLSAKDVLVGVPRQNDARTDNAGETMNNATLAYIQDRGSPAANIPARPFMAPGIMNAQERIASQLRRGIQDLTSGKQADVDVSLSKAGMIAQASIRHVINDGPPPPLAESTIADRKRRGRLSEKPLVDTGQLRNSINYVLRERKTGKSSADQEVEQGLEEGAEGAIRGLEEGAEGAAEAIL